MSPALPPTRKGRESRERVLAAAHTTFSRLGYVDTRVQDIAAEAGIALGGLYRYFTSKDDVFAEILRNVQREILLKTSSHGRSTGGLDVHAGNRSFLEYCAENPGLMRAYHQSESVSPQFRIAATRVRRAITRRMLATLERSERLAGTYDPDRVMLQVTSLLICTETIGLSAFALEEEPLASCTIDQLTEIADGLWLGSLSELIPGLLE